MTLRFNLLALLAAAVLIAPAAEAQTASKTSKAAVGYAKPVATATTAPTRPAPGYSVIEGVSPDTVADDQTVTLACPAGLRATGAGFSGMVRSPAGSPAGAPPFANAMVARVYSLPEARGMGWRVQASIPAAARKSQPWRLAVRVVCARIAD